MTNDNSYNCLFNSDLPCSMKHWLFCDMDDNSKTIAFYLFRMTPEQKAKSCEAVREIFEENSQ